MKDEKAIVLAYQEAHNAHDVEQAMSYFAPNIRFEMAGLWVREGFEEIKVMEEWDAVVGGKIAFGDPKVRSGRFECKAKEINDWFDVVGIEAVFYESYRFEFENGRISRIRAKISPKSEMAIDKVINRIMRWALDARPDDIQNIIPRGQFNYGKEQAEGWMTLVKEWKQQADQMVE